MRQLRLFERPGVDILEKLLAEREAGIKINYHWNGKAL